MSDEWKQDGDYIIETKTSRIYKALLPKPAYYLSCRVRFDSAEEAKQVAAGMDSNIKRLCHEGSK